jgi:hypothetical protein
MEHRIRLPKQVSVHNLRSSLTRQAQTNHDDRRTKKVVSSHCTLVQWMGRMGLCTACCALCGRGAPRRLSGRARLVTAAWTNPTMSSLVVPAALGTLAAMVGAAADPTYPPELIIGECTRPSARGWQLTSDGELRQGNMCATCGNPPGNGGFAYMAACGGGVPWQRWIWNASRWHASAANVSGSLMLPAEADSSADFGFTYDKNADRAHTQPSSFPANKTAPIQIFDIGPNGRFPGECRGNSNCNFKYDEAAGTFITYHGLCLATNVPTPPAPPPPKPPPPPPFASTPCIGGGEGDICFSWALGSSMVLQQAPAKTAVYGWLTGGPTSSTVAVTVATEGRGGGDAPYTVPAVLTTAPPGTNHTALWKAVLRPAAAGGNFSISAKCTAGCSGGAVIHNLTFGDVW